MSRRPEVTELKAVSKTKFDPSKIYTWDAEEKFVITGAELDILNKALATQTENRLSDYQKFLWLQRGLQTMNGILAEAFDDELIAEQKPKDPTPTQNAVEQKAE